MVEREMRLRSGVTAPHSQLSDLEEVTHVLLPCHQRRLETQVQGYVEVTLTSALVYRTKSTGLAVKADLTSTPSSAI